MLKLKQNSSAVKAYYAEIQNLSQLNLFKEGAVSPAFGALLRVCGRQMGWTLAEQYDIKHNGRNLRVDGALLDDFRLAHGYWEAKDTDDDLAKEVKKKFAIGYPNDNILFQAPDRAILYQQGQLVIDEDISKADALVEVLKLFFDYQPPAYAQWGQAVEEFKNKVPELAQGVLALIEKERRINRAFISAFDDFTAMCREAINPNLSVQAVEEMLIQHLLTERMKLSKDKTQLVYNDFLTLEGIPPEAFEYRLGNRSALEWIIDQYRVRADKRSGIVSDPNRLDDPEYIVRLIGKVITVSVETVKLVKSLPALSA
jgi:hypothetical protein